MPVQLKVTSFIKNHILSFILILAVINGMIFIFLIPPWEHYDEPGHFEYAWLVANLDHWPEANEFNQSMRREVGASLLNHDFHEYSIYHLLKTDEPISIITPQTGEFSIYYLLVSLPLRLLKHTDITFQLYISRFVSLSLFLLTIFLSYKTCCTIFSDHHPLTWMVPGFLLFLPSFADIMTAVNNDAIAIAAMSLFFYASTLMIKNGFRVKTLLLLLFSVVLCILSKSNAWLAAPLSVLVLVLSVFKNRSLIFLGIVIIVGFLAGTALLFSWKNTAPAFFYATYDRFLPTRLKSEGAPVGDMVIAQDNQPDQLYNLLLSPDTSLKIRGKSVTLGTWIWSDSPASVIFPQIICSNNSAHIVLQTSSVAITTTPQFFAFNAKMPEDITGICWLQFLSTGDTGNWVYWDGILLTTEIFTDEFQPQFSDNDAKNVTWNEKTFPNLVRNASGEKAWPVFSARVRELLSETLYFSSSRIFAAIDLRSHLWYFQAAAASIFRSFWAIFGWGRVMLLGKRPYWFFLFLTAASLLGFVLSLFQKNKLLPLKITLFFSLSIALQTGLVILRGVGSWFWRLFIPGARYLYPVIIPIAILFVSGFYMLMTIFHHRLKIPDLYLKVFYVCIIIGMMLWAVVSLSVHF